LRILSVLVALVLLVVEAPASSAQTVQGNLVEDSTKTPVAGALVRLLDEQARERARTTTDERGAFRLDAPGAGVYWLRLEPTGFRIVETDPFFLSRAETRTLDLETRSGVVKVEGVTVESRTVQNVNYAGFLSRQHSGKGRYYGPGELRTTHNASDMLRGLAPGLDAVNMRDVGNVLVFRNRGRMCPPMVIVDGNAFNQRRVQWNIDTLALGEEVRAVEVYSEPQTVPGSLSPSGDNICGAVAIWTASGLGID
jgi:hypothetical protein